MQDMDLICRRKNEHYTTVLPWKICKSLQSIDRSTALLNIKLCNEQFVIQRAENFSGRFFVGVFRVH